MVLSMQGLPVEAFRKSGGPFMSIHDTIKRRTVACTFYIFFWYCLAFQDTVAAEGNSGRDVGNLIEIVNIQTTRPVLSAGTPIGIMAEIKNISKDTDVYLNEKGVTLILPPELLGPDKQMEGWYAYFPSEQHEPYPATISVVLKPGSVYKVVWTNSPEIPFSDLSKMDAYHAIMKEKVVIDKENKALKELSITLDTVSIDILRKKIGSLSDGFSANLGFMTFKALFDNVATQLVREWMFLFFTPGDYEVTVQAKYYVSKEDSGNSQNYGLTSKSQVVYFNAPQFVILFGAALGGLIGNVVFPKKTALPKKTYKNKFILLSVICWKRFVDTLGVVLLSVIVTILLARISETQFFVKVSINDLWGAIAVGFIASISGKKLLDKILQVNIGDGENEGESKKDDESRPKNDVQNV